MTINPDLQPTVQQESTPRILWVILGLACLLRLIFVLTLDPNPNLAGGDSAFLLEYGKQLVNNTMPVPPAAGPTYMFLVGWVNVTVQPPNTIIVLRLLNVLMSTLTCGFLYSIGARYFSPRVGLVSATIMALSPIFIIEAGSILTETTFLFLLFGGLALYASRYAHFDLRVGAEPDRRDRRALPFGVLVGVGILLGMATLTRAVAILFPLVLVLHLLYLKRGRALGAVAILLLSYALTVSTWTVYTFVRWNRFIIAAEGFAANIYIGTTSWCGPACIDQRAGIDGQGDNQSKYVAGAVASITGDFGGYMQHRLRNLTESLLQPHNTAFFAGESIKTVISTWWNSGRSLQALPQIFTSDAFWPKLTLYAFHYLALVGALLGALLGIRRFGALLPVYGALGYFIAIHTVLTANPRYLFVATPAAILFTGYALCWIADRIGARRGTNRVISVQPPQDGLINPTV